MTHVSHHPARIASVPATYAPRLAPNRWRILPYVAVFAAGATGLLLGRALGGNSETFENTLLLLLRFMAAMKFLGVLAAAIGLHWRLGHPIGAPLAAAYIATLVPMALASGLIWSLGAIALGALLFHVGLLAFLYLAWIDDGVRLTRRWVK